MKCGLLSFEERRITPAGLIQPPLRDDFPYELNGMCCAITRSFAAATDYDVLAASLREP